MSSASVSEFLRDEPLTVVVAAVVVLFLLWHWTSKARRTLIGRSHQGRKRKREQRPSPKANDELTAKAWVLLFEPRVNYRLGTASLLTLGLLYTLQELLAPSVEFLKLLAFGWVYAMFLPAAVVWSSARWPNRFGSFPRITGGLVLFMALLGAAARYVLALMPWTEGVSADLLFNQGTLVAMGTIVFLLSGYAHQYYRVVRSIRHEGNRLCEAAREGNAEYLLRRAPILREHTPPHWQPLVNEELTRATQALKEGPLDLDEIHARLPALRQEIELQELTITQKGASLPEHDLLPETTGNADDDTLAQWQSLLKRWTRNYALLKDLGTAVKADDLKRIKELLGHQRDIERLLADIEALRTQQSSTAASERKQPSVEEWAERIGDGVYGNQSMNALLDVRKERREQIDDDPRLSPEEKQLLRAKLDAVVFKELDRLRRR